MFNRVAVNPLDLLDPPRERRNSAISGERRSLLNDGGRRCFNILMDGRKKREKKGGEKEEEEKEATRRIHRSKFINKQSLRSRNNPPAIEFETARRIRIRLRGPAAVKRSGEAKERQ